VLLKNIRVTLNKETKYISSEN